MSGPTFFNKLVSAAITRVADARPPIRGRRSLPGLEAEVRLSFTEGGIPRLDAETERDLWFAHGWVTASDRLFQMDLSRRAARGELSEVLGPEVSNGSAPEPGAPSLVDVDHALQQLGLASVARSSVEAMDPMERPYFEAYAAGVNAWIDEGTPALEARLLGYTPRRWTVEDSAAVWLIFAFQHSRGWRDALAHEIVRGEGDAAGAARLLALLETGVGRGHARCGVAPEWRTLTIPADRAAYRHPVVATSAFTGASAPSPLHLVSLQLPGWSATGASIPGIPGLLVGRNPFLTWAPASTPVRDADWARERLDAGSDVSDAGAVRVATADGFEAVEQDTCEIRVRHRQEAERRTLRFTSNGPLFGSDFLGNGADVSTGLALRWTGHVPTRSLEGLMGLARARNASELRESASLLGAPVLDFHWAELSGAVGVQRTGLVPRRLHPETRGIVPATSAELGWEGLEPFENLPANDGVAGSAGLNGSFEDGAKLPWTVSEALELLAEPPLPLLELSERVILTALAELRPTGRRRVILAIATGHEEAPARATHAAARAFIDALVQELRPAGSESRTNAFARSAALRVLATESPQAFTTLLAPESHPNRSAWLSAANRAAVSALARLERVCGRRPESWDPKALATDALRHPLEGHPLVGALLRPGRSEADQESVLPAGPPALQHGLDFASANLSLAILSTGESGDPTSARYRDHLARWRTGGAFRIPFGTRTPRGETDAVLEPRRFLRQPTGS